MKRLAIVIAVAITSAVALTSVAFAESHDQCFPDPAQSVQPFTPVGNPQPATLATPTIRPFVPTTPFINPTGPVTEDVPRPADAVHERSAEERAEREYRGSTAPGHKWTQRGGNICAPGRLC